MEVEVDDRGGWVGREEVDDGDGVVLGRSWWEARGR